MGMKTDRAARAKQVRADAACTKERNGIRKTAETARRDARMYKRIAEDSLPYTPDVQSWLSRKLDKPSGKITEADIKALTASK